jgi:O-antigen ligase
MPDAPDGSIQTANPPTGRLRAALRSDLTVCLLVLAVYARFGDVAWNLWHIPYLTLAMILVAALVVSGRSVLERRWPIGLRRAALAVGVYLLVCSASLLYAENTRPAHLALTELIQGAAIVGVVVGLIGRAHALRRAVWALIAAGTLMATLTVAQRWTGTFAFGFFGFERGWFMYEFQGETYYRSTGPFDDPNYYAQALLIAVPLALNRLLSARSIRQTLLPAWAFTACLLAITSTYSRGGFVGAVVVLACMAVAAYRQRPRALNLAVAAASIAAVCWLAPPVYASRIASLEQALTAPPTNTPVQADPDRADDAQKTRPADAAVQPDLSGSGRQQINRVGWRMFLDHPLHGIGIGQFATSYPHYARFAGVDLDAKPIEAHNLYLEVAAETGVLGLAAFGALLATLFRGLARSRRTLAQAGRTDDAQTVGALAVALVGYLTAAVFLHAAYTHLFWLLIGIALAVPNTARVDPVRTQPSIEH